MTDRPTCACHGEPMYSNCGRWRCGVRHREYMRKYREENRGANREYMRKYREENRGATREYARKRMRRNLGIPEHQPVADSAAISARGNAVKSLKQTHDDPVAMTLVERRDARRAKLLRLAFHPGTPSFERRRALDKLIAPNPRTNEEAVDGSKTTSAG